MIYLKNTTAPQEVWIPRQDTNIQAVPKDCYTEGYDDGYNSGYEEGMKEGIPLQDKSVAIEKDLTEVLPDAGYSAMTKVEVDATEYAQGRYDAGYADGKAEFRLQDKVYEVKGDTGNVTADDDYDALSRVEVDAVMYGKSKYSEGNAEGYASGYSEGQASVRMQEKSVSADTATVEVTPDEGYSGLTKVSVDSSQYGQAQYQSGYTEGQESVRIQSKSVEITGDTQTIVPDSGFDAMSSVTADAGTYGEARYNEGHTEGYAEGQASVTLQEKSVSSDTATVEVIPDSGYSGMSKVTVDSSQYGQNRYEEGVEDGKSSFNLQEKSLEISENGETVIEPDAGYDALSRVTVNVRMGTGTRIDVEEYGLKFAFSTFTEFPYDFFDLSHVTNAHNMFQNCEQMTRFDGFEGAKITHCNSLFSTCSALTAVTELDMVDNYNGINDIFFACRNLEEVPQLINTEHLAEMQNAFNMCEKLKKIPAFDCSGMSGEWGRSSFAGYNDLNNLTDMGGFLNLRGSITENGFERVPNLSEESCINILDGLYDFTGHAETPGDNEGVLKVHQNFLDKVGDRISIATAKGWQITV